MKTLNLKSVNKKIQEKWPALRLVKGNGYFYFVSNDPFLGTALDCVEHSVYVYKLNDQRLNQWISDADAVMNLVGDLPLPKREYWFISGGMGYTVYLDGQCFKYKRKKQYRFAVFAKIRATPTGSKKKKRLQSGWMLVGFSDAEGGPRRMIQRFLNDDQYDGFVIEKEIVADFDRTKMVNLKDTG